MNEDLFRIIDEQRTLLRRARELLEWAKEDTADTDLKAEAEELLQLIVAEDGTWFTASTAF